jgi:hypothetical protein
MRSVRPGLSTCAALTALVAAFLAGPLRGQEPADTVADLRNLYGRGYILQDRNQDDVVDFVRARILLPAAPTDADAASAANLAARLGYETAATNLGLVTVGPPADATFDLPVILIGAHDALLARAAVVAPVGLAPGQGAVTFIPAGSVFRAGALLVSGADATGTLAAADYLSGRYPSVWAVRGGQTWADVADRLGRFLTQEQAVPSSLTLDRVVVEAGKTGVTRLHASALLGDVQAFERAVGALTGRARADSTGARGAGAGPAGRGAGAAPQAGGAPDTAVTNQPGAANAPGTPSGNAQNLIRLADLSFTDLHRIDLTIRSAARDTIVRLLPQRPWPEREAAAYNPGGSPDFTLSDLYTIRGLYRDTDQDLVPDRVDSYLSIHGGLGSASAADLATRIGLETAGMRLPIARVAGQDDYPQNAGFPVLFGVDHYQTERLRAQGKLYVDTGGAGTGFMQFVARDLGGRNGLLIGGSDEAGLRAITDYAAQRMPYLWEHGKGNYLLSDVETQVRRFLQAREAPGQAALALHKIETFLGRLSGKPIDSLAVEIATKDQLAGLEGLVEGMLRERFPNARRSVRTFKTGFGAGRPIFTQQFDIPWEVDSFWEAFRKNALPRIAAGSRGRIEVRVSESPEIRAQIAREIRHELGARGVAEGSYEVRVLSAYKQGYSWLNDVILPRLKGQPVRRIEITYHNLKDSKEVRWQEIEAETRWLQEIYPVDAVMARELAIPDSMITFRATYQREPIYTVRAFGDADRVLLEESFDPRYVVRPFFDLFPEYEQVRVTTGWVTVESNGEKLLDERIQTDPERFWDVLQADTYKRILDYVMDIQDGEPAPENAPYFDEFKLDITLSEPNYRIGIDEEVISSAEALHEDIYFETLTLFSLLGQRYGVGAMDYPGRVLPYIRPSVEGGPGRAVITLTGKERGVPELVFVHRESGKEPDRKEYPLSPLGFEAPRIRGITTRASTQGLEQMLFEVVVTDSIDRYEEMRLRSTEQGIDRQFLSPVLVQGMVGQLARLHQAGIAENALSFDRVGEVALRMVMRDTTKAHLSWMTSVERSRRPLSTARPTLADRSFRWNGQRIVQWDTPIPPAESAELLAKLETFPVVNTYWVGRSFLGQDIWAADFLPPHEARYVSQAKLNALKPTLMLSGRQHANEVSSTSHILRLGELLATDTAYTSLLKKVNVVLHPITNPDGARLAYEMQLENPDFMLHAGYLGALGVDATSGAGTDDPIYPESNVRPELQETWLPDIFINMHGYPSHEWVQYFAGYSAWVRSRSGAQRSWWAPRGWFIPGYNYNEDPRNPDFQRAQMAVLDTITKSIAALPDVMAMNKRMYTLYAKYGKQDMESFREYFRNDVLVSLALRGTEVGGAGINSRRVTWVSTTTESPDETARGDWLELVASAGLAHGSSLIRYLATGKNEIRTEASEFEGVVMRSAARRKPVTPPAPATPPR